MRSTPLIRRVFSAAPDIALGSTYLITWINPGAFDTNLLPYLTLMMALEFIVIHSAGFMGVVALSDARRHRRVAGIIGLGVFYSIFVVGFAVLFGRWWPVWAFWSLTLNRLTGVIFSTGSGHDTAGVQAGWGVSALFYLVGAFATTFLPIPRFGITPEIARTAAIAGEGLWVDEPHRMIAFGAAYFLGQAAVDLLEPQWIRGSG